MTRRSKGRGAVALIGWLVVLVVLVGPQGSSCNAFNRMFREAGDFVGNSVKAGVSFMTTSETTTTPTTTSRPETSLKSQEDSDADELNSDFESQCLLSRGANLRVPPQVFFFPSRDHGEATLGCTPNRVITLSLEGDGTKLEDNPNDWKLDTDSIQRLVVDSAGGYDASAPSYMLVHGFMADWSGDAWMCLLKDRILNETQANVFIVDWSGGSKPMLPIDYGAAVGNTKYVGQLLAKFILTLVQMTNQKDATRFHLIGHSLGSHISGFVGYALDSTTLGRITGLDPAGPCFTSSFGRNSTELTRTGELSGGKKRLSSASAQLVVAIHTDAGRFGLNENCGHYDIYVNGGGSPQPRCQSVSDRVNNLLRLRVMDAIDLADIACAHGYAHSLTDDAYLIFKAIVGRLVRRDTQQQMQQYKFAPAEKQCYLEAYRCASWAAFKKGECGLNADRQDGSYALDALAMDPRLDARKMADDAAQASLLSPLEEAIDNLQSDSDDEHMNEEEIDATLASSIIPIQKLSDTPNKHWQHFIKTGHSKTSICAYTYQIVIATEPKVKRCKLYVGIPLDKEPGLVDVHTGGKAKERLVQVSHRVASGSWAQIQLQKVNENLMDNSNRLNYYTALISFDSALSVECRDIVSSKNPKTKRDRWYLCKAISNIEEARLWSPGDKCLKSVKWVAMSYLSGSNATIRRENSYLFEPDSSGIEKNKPVSAGTKMKGGQKEGLLDQLVGGVQSGVKCLTTSVNPLMDSSCDIGGIYLKFSTPLKVVTDKKKRRALQI